MEEKKISDSKKKLMNKIRILYWKGKKLTTNVSCSLDDELNLMCEEDLKKIIEKYQCQKNVSKNSESAKGQLRVVGNSIEYLLSLQGVTDVILSDESFVKSFSKNTKFIDQYIPSYFNLLYKTWGVALKWYSTKREKNEHKSVKQ